MTTNLENVMETRQSVDVVSLEKLLSLVCEKDAKQIRVAAKLCYPSAFSHAFYGYLCYTLVPWESFCRTIPKRDEVADETNALFHNLLEENGPCFYVRVDCP